MDINKAKESLKGYLNWLKTTGFSMAKNDKAIQTILSELEKKDKIINDMSEQLAGLTIWNNEKEEPLILIDKQEVINYFTNKVEEDK